MLLRNSISSTKKFFQKTIDNVKSFLSKTPYERLPKTPPFNPFSCGRRRKMEIHIAGRYKDSQESTTGTDYCSTRHRHHDFTDNQWSLSKGSTTKATTEAVADDQKNKGSAAATGKENYLDQKLATIEEKASDSPVKGNIDNNGRREFGRGMNNGGGGGGGRRRQETCFRDTRRMNCWVTQKLKEFEMVDRSNIDYLLDIEEVLHYYSRLTCPPYLELVDNFFVEMYAEFCDGPQSVPAGGTQSAEL